MDHTVPLEDERGVDRAAVRELLRMTPAERVDRLIQVVATWNAMHDSAGAAARPNA
ncbi:MAG: hypothetical protein H0V93_15685 [Euzebyales bacterium]|nr:hypothetical protein [Euzebyales bacterium]